MMNNKQVTMPRYRENHLTIPFSMLCPGISQNTKHHHLTLYKGQVWEEKSYLELCNHNSLNILYPYGHVNFGQWDMRNLANDKWPLKQNAELLVPPLPGYGFINDNTKLPWDSEILQSFAEQTHITNIMFHPYKMNPENVRYELIVGSLKCDGTYHFLQCVPPSGYNPKYIWTKEGFKIQIQLFRFKIIIFNICLF